MKQEELFAAAKEEIFGQIPECLMARVGRNTAISYFSTLVEDAEAVMLDMRKPHNGFNVMLTNAFGFAHDMALSAFPEEAKAVIQTCTDNFRARYEPLLEELNLKAA